MSRHRAALGAMMSREVESSDSYTDRVKKLIPAEVSAAFLAINASIPLDDNFTYFVIGFFVVLAIICIFYLRAMEHVTSLGQLLFISGVAFPVWALNIAIDRIDFMQDKLFLASGLLVLVTLVVPLLVRSPRP
jgi:hypothetical protein